MNTILALIFAGLMSVHNGAELVPYGDDDSGRLAVRISSVDWNKPAATNPYAKLRDVDGLRARGVTREVCVRSDHRLPGELRIDSNRFRPVRIPHDTGLKTRCAIVRTYGWASQRQVVTIAEGTYWGSGGTTDGPVYGWLRSFSVRTAP